MNRTQKDFGPEEWALRVQLAATYRIFDMMRKSSSGPGTRSEMWL